MPEITGFAFPNDIHIHWWLMIVMYPYITGLRGGRLHRHLALPPLRQEGAPAGRAARAWRPPSASCSSRRSRCSSTSATPSAACS